MITIHHVVDVPYPPQMMYELVNAVSEYPQFVPFCTKGTVKPIRSGEVKGTITLSWLGISESWSTLNTLTPYKTVEMNLLTGPFKHLKGTWSFTPLEHQQTRVTFVLEFEVMHPWLDRLLQPIWKMATYEGIQAFIKRAEFLSNQAEGNDFKSNP